MSKEFSNQFILPSVREQAIADINLTLEIEESLKKEALHELRTVLHDKLAEEEQLLPQNTLEHAISFTIPSKGLRALLPSFMQLIEDCAEKETLPVQEADVGEVITHWLGQEQARGAFPKEFDLALYYKTKLTESDYYTLSEGEQKAFAPHWELRVIITPKRTR